MAVQFEREIEPMPKSARQGHSGAQDGTKPTRGKARCHCGGTTRHKPSCDRYSGKQKPTGGGVHKKAHKKPPPAPTREVDLAERMNGHRSAAALAIAREKVLVDLEDTRQRKLELEAEIRVLERLAAGLAEGASA